MDSNNHFLYVNNVTFDFNAKGTTVKLLDSFSSEFVSGKIYVLMGSNGCGKSTLLKILSGEIKASSGSIDFCSSSGKCNPSLDYMPQDYRQALFPWKTVQDNIYPWVQKYPILDNFFDFSNPRQENVVLDSLDTLNISSLALRYPYELSGGQQQLILLSRCLASPANIIVLDEPFSALDVKRRTTISQQLRKYWQTQDKIVICAIHEPDEVAILADEVLMFNGPPLELIEIVKRNLDDSESSESFRKRIVFKIQTLIH
jgi:NitT/TauT family transport system ATP-binding protein